MNLFATDNTSFLEPDVLERFSRAAVEHRCTSFVSTLCRQVALRDPSRSAMRGRRQLCERVFRPRKLVFRLVEASLLEERAAEHDARVPDLVEHVVALADDLQGVQRLLLGALDVAGAQVDLRERRDGGRDLSSRPASAAIATECLRFSIACSDLPSRNSRPPRLLSSRATFARSASSSYCAFAFSA